MGADDKEVGHKKEEETKKHTDLATSHGTLPEKYDLDKNPIKFRQADGSLSTEAHDKDYMELALRSGKHSDLVKKIMRQRIEQRAQEFPRWPGSQTGGVRLMWIESRFWYDRERLLPDFDDDWRKYRARYLHSLELDPREPVHVPEYERWLINPIRRFYMKGGDFLEEKIIKRLITKNPVESATYRFVAVRYLWAYLGFIGIAYWMRNGTATWESRAGATLVASAPIIYPDHPDFPFKDYKTEPAHFYDLGFSRRRCYKDLRDYEDGTVVL